MLILGIILFGLVVGALAPLVLGMGKGGVDWGLARVAGLIGSFVGAVIVVLVARAVRKPTTARR